MGEWVGWVGRLERGERWRRVGKGGRGRLLSTLQFSPPWFE